MERPIRLVSSEHHRYRRLHKEKALTRAATLTGATAEAVDKSKIIIPRPGGKGKI